MGFWSYILSVGATASIQIGGGNNVETDRIKAGAKLLDLCERAVSRKDFNADPLPGGHWVTKCNWGAQFIATGFGCHDLDGKNATEMFAAMLASALANPERDVAKGWREDSEDRAVKHALNGGLAFMSMPKPSVNEHGHIAAVAPMAMEASTSWGRKVPMLANVGLPPNGIKRASQCFLIAHQPILKCFLWGDTP